MNRVVMAVRGLHDVAFDAVVYAQHGRELMGFKSLYVNRLSLLESRQSTR